LLGGGYDNHPAPPNKWEGEKEGMGRIFHNHGLSKIKTITNNKIADASCDY
jgi:hypothetical protein